MNQDIKSIVVQVAVRCRDMLLRPMDTWSAIAAEPGGVKEALVPYAAVMGLVPSLMMLTVRAGSILFMLKTAVLSYAGCLLFPLVIGKLMELAAPLFGARKSWALSCRVLVYAATPVYAASLLGIIPILGALLMLLTLPWALILLYLGIGRVLATQGARQLLFTLSTIVVSLIISSLSMSAFALHPGRPAAVNALPIAATQLSDETSGMVAAGKVASGQGTEADIALAADYSLKQMIAAGQVKPGEEAKTRADMVQAMRTEQAAVKAAQAAQKN